MNYKFYYIITLCIVLSFSSCIGTDLKFLDGYYYENYIMGYLTPTSIAVDIIPIETVSGDLHWVDNRITVSFNGDMISEGDDKFNELAIQYGDTTFKRNSFPEFREVLNDSILAIRVETLDDFNEQYPAGSDISNITEMLYLSYFDYVQNGYEESVQDSLKTAEWERWYAIPYPSSCSRIKKILPEVNPSNTKLIVLPTFQLKFLKNPEKSGNHRFKLFIKMNNLDVEKQFEYDFSDSL